MELLWRVPDRDSALQAGQYKPWGGQAALLVLAAPRPVRHPWVVTLGQYWRISVCLSQGHPRSSSHTGLIAVLSLPSQKNPKSASACKLPVCKHWQLLFCEAGCHWAGTLPRPPAHPLWWGKVSPWGSRILVQGMSQTLGHINIGFPL